MSSLPVIAVLPELLSTLQYTPQVLLNASTGVGKSAWLPLQILAEGNIAGRIILLEPRRLTTCNVVQWLAELLGGKPGKTVGYRMRVEACVGSQTRLEVVTEGVLTCMIQYDSELAGVGLVILDEFHEHSLQAGLVLVLLLDVQQGLRDDLRLLVMSTTLDNDRLQRLLPEASMVVPEGRAYPVERRFNPPPMHQHFDEAVAVAAVELLRYEQGLMLLFLPGVGEIQRIQEQLTGCVVEDVILCLLYGALPLSGQRKAVLPALAGKRKVALAANIAETSLIIEGIRLVVDSTQEWAARFDPRTGLIRLVTQRISQASTMQCAGRAGRLPPGICLHLLGKEQAERVAMQSEPEILYSDLSALLLELLQQGCHDPAALVWLGQPSAANLAAVRRLLEAPSVLNGERLPAFGRKMATPGNEPRLATMLVATQIDDEATTVVRLMAILEELLCGGLVDLGAVSSRQQANWQQRAQQLMRRLARHRGQPDTGEMAGLLASAFADCIARRRGQEGRYQPANGIGAMLDVGDVLGRYEWLIAPLLLQGSTSSDVRMLLALPVGIGELIAARPKLVQRSDTVEWDEAQGMLRAWRRMVVDRLVIRTQPLAKPFEAELHQVMPNGIREKGLDALNRTPETEQLRLRLQCTVQQLSEEAWPAVDDVSLLVSLEAWLLPQMNGIHSLWALKALDLRQALQDWLPRSLHQKLDHELSTYYTVSTGSRLAIRCHTESPPALAVRMQEMFGEATTSVIAEGQVSLMPELLSSVQRPLWIIRDLSAFWQGSYREVQKEMKGRYPKHVRSDDPANTAPI